MFYGGKHRPVAYLQLDPLARACPSCLIAVATAAKLVETSAELLLGSDLYLQVLHAVDSL